VVNILDIPCRKAMLVYVLLKEVTFLSVKGGKTVGVCGVECSLYTPVIKNVYSFLWKLINTFPCKALHVVKCIKSKY